MYTRTFFLFSILVPLIIDHIVTVVGQPSLYWSDFSYASEGSPARFLLVWHPALFLLWGAAYALLVWLLGRKLPQKWVLPLGLLVYTGHAWGSASWIPQILELAGADVSLQWYVSIGYFAILAFILGWGIARCYHWPK
jgi:hypothetical protein